MNAFKTEVAFFTFLASEIFVPGAPNEAFIQDRRGLEGAQECTTDVSGCSS
jgi:hypothetical protein